MKQPRSVVIGLGRMGMRHIEVLQGLKIPIEGVFDVRTDAVRDAVERWKLPTNAGYHSVDALLKEVSPEMVVIASTAPSHCELVLAAVDAGASIIFCEKPLATSLAECDRMVEACTKKNVQLIVNHQMRFMDQYTIPRSLLHGEKFGGFSSMTVIAGNFGVAMNGTHYVEAFSLVSKEEPVIVRAKFGPMGVANPRGKEFVDLAGSLYAETASGKRFYLDTSADQGFGIQAIYAGRFGQIHVNEGFGVLYAEYRLPKERELPSTRILTPCHRYSEYIQITEAVESTRRVLNSALNGGEFCTGNDARKAIRCIIAAHISSEEGRTVALSEEMPVERNFPWA